MSAFASGEPVTSDPVQAAGEHLESLVDVRGDRVHRLGVVREVVPRVVVVRGGEIEDRHPNSRCESSSRKGSSRNRASRWTRRQTVGMRRGGCTRLRGRTEHSTLRPAERHRKTSDWGCLPGRSEEEDAYLGSLEARDAGLSQASQAPYWDAPWFRRVQRWGVSVGRSPHECAALV